MTPLPEVVLDGRTLTPDALVSVVRGRAEARMDPAARERNAAADLPWALATCASSAVVARPVEAEAR